MKDGPAALEAVRALRPDVVVLDISMPGMSGLEVAGRLRRAGSTVPIVFLTIHDDEELVLATQAAGGIGYVVKTPAAVGSGHRGQRSVRRPALRVAAAMKQKLRVTPRAGCDAKRLPGIRSW